MSNLCSKDGEKFTDTERQIMTCIINNSNVYYFNNMYIWFISKVVQPLIMKMLYEEEMVYV